MKAIIIVLCSSIALSILYSFNYNDHSTISGKVTYYDDGSAISFGTVALIQNGKIVKGVETDLNGNYQFNNVTAGNYELEASYIGFTPTRQSIVKNKLENLVVNLAIKEGHNLSDIVITEYKVPLVEFDNTTSGATVTSDDIRRLPTKSTNAIAATTSGVKSKNNDLAIRGDRSQGKSYYIDGVRVHNPNQTMSNGTHLYYHENEKSQPYENESYTAIVENKFTSPIVEALSTFSIDVDRASYSNVRRYLTNGQMPPPDAVRIEEMINYFDYKYDGPKNDEPFAIHKYLVDCPWNKDHQLMHVALQGKRLEKANLPASNLVFLIDVSGSMGAANKLPLVQSSLKMLVNEMKDEDRIAIVVYAGAAGIVLESTPTSEKEKIYNAINNLKSGGSTAGGAGIKLAYKTAQKHFIKDGNNRVILATDGDFNVGTSDEDGLEDLIEAERESGVFLSVLGFGMGNYKDSKMQILADKGNGNHSYIDNIQEARKVFVSEFAGTLYTIAKDVKIQIEFNPAHVQAYRLIGYENRMLAKEDFNNDQIDAGELGAGHTVTALYEIVPVGVTSRYFGKVDKLKYQSNPNQGKYVDQEFATIKLRYKKPDGDKSRKIVTTLMPNNIKINDAPDYVKFAASIAQFGLILRKSDYLNDNKMDQMIQLAKSAKTNDDEGYKAECIRIMKSTQLMQTDLLAGKE